MRTKLATFAMAGALGLTGLAGAALLAPAVSYAATGDSTALSDRVSKIAEDLKGLVTDGTLTQDQADKVATVIAESHPGPGGDGGPGGHMGPGAKLEAAATALGLSTDELRTELEAGKTLADIADEKGVDQAVLVDALVAAEMTHLAEKVADGDLTQAQADERAAELEARVTDSLDKARPAGGPGGPGHHGPRGDAPDTEADDADAEPSTSSSSTTESSTTTTGSNA